MQRKSLRFEGKVQRVGFRFEAELIARRLGLTGSAENLADGSVSLELQGHPEAIQELVTAMKGLRRIRITRIQEKDLPVFEGEQGFSIL